jgi:hypothetical protein
LNGQASWCTWTSRSSARSPTAVAGETVARPAPTTRSAATPVHPQRNRPVALVCRRPRGRRSGAQQSAPQDSRLEDPNRGLQGATTVASTSRCCNDRLNSLSSAAGGSSMHATATTWSARWAASAPQATTLPWGVVLLAAAERRPRPPLLDHAGGPEDRDRQVDREDLVIRPTALGDEHDFSLPSWSGHLGGSAWSSAGVDEVVNGAGITESEQKAEGSVMFVHAIWRGRPR